MTNYLIETDVPVPTTKRPGGRNAKYPFKQMEVGDSYMAEVTDEDAKRHQRAAQAYGRRNGIKFTSRRSSDGVRIWRVA